MSCRQARTPLILSTGFPLQAANDNLVAVRYPEWREAAAALLFAAFAQAAWTDFLLGRLQSLS